MNQVKLSFYDRTGQILKIKKSLIWSDCVDVFGNDLPAGDFTEIKQNFLNSSKNLGVVVNDMMSFSVFCGAISCLSRGQINKLIVFSDVALMDYIKFGEFGELSYINNKIEEGDLFFVQKGDLIDLKNKIDCLFK